MQKRRAIVVPLIEYLYYLRCLMHLSHAASITPSPGMLNVEALHSMLVKRMAQHVVRTFANMPTYRL